MKYAICHKGGRKIATTQVYDDRETAERALARLENDGLYVAESSDGSMVIEGATT